jgi:2,3-dihydroxybiphenyl 1,2-dioxygenase
VAAWERFAVDVLGLSIGARTPAGGFTLRIDSRAQRFFVEPGDADDVSVIGWEHAGEAALAATVLALRSGGHGVVEAAAAEAAARGVERLFRTTDPGGMPLDLYAGPALAREPFRSALVPSGFVAEEQGLGHAVVNARTQEESLAFYTRLLGCRLSDFIRCELHGFPVDIAFLHANARHHSVALAVGQKKRIHHFMLEMASLDDVGRCMDRAIRAGVRIMQTLGKHPNDRMISFYARTPSGFQFEVGWGGRRVDDATWEPTTYDHVSEWGHHPPEFVVKWPAKGGQA